MKIAHVIPGLTVERGGPSAVLAAMVRHQIRDGHSVSVLTTDQGARHGEQLFELDAAAKVVRCAVTGPDRVAYAPSFRHSACRLLKGADLVHLHSIFTYPIHTALGVARQAGVPTILRPCGQLHSYSLQRSRLAKQIYLGLWGRDVTDSVTAWHYTSPEEAAASWPNIARGHFVLGNGIEPEEFAIDRREARAAVDARWPLLAGSRFILFLARLHSKKRLDLLLQAFLEANIPNCKLVVAGPDEEGIWQKLSCRAIATRNQNRVVRLQTVSGAAKRDLLAAATAFALPSEHENFGVAALEAVAAGTPVLLSPHVDLAGPITAAGWGRTIPLEVADWRRELEQAANAPEYSLVMDSLRRTWLEENYTWRRIVQRLLEHYRELQASPTLDSTAICS